uniref:RBR-type E3 ubiquitin transferase n=1 Tax=Nicotiana sylvestris TaxID=4096 RepID=A0A1U7WET3_NICSY|nr:PREDICTED: probable E3 ubiquitin-protein ligase ARI9 [Nicotiana sylvestris]
MFLEPLMKVPKVSVEFGKTKREHIECSTSKKYCSRHSFCSHCIGLYVQSKIRDNIFPITCPGLRCGVVIQPESCRSIIPVNAFARWEEGSTESAIPNSEKFYCPYKRCSGLFIHDNHEEVIECICPLCKKLFCAKCRVPWHTGRDCDKFQIEEKNREDELKLKLLAENKKWKECPKCKSIVEKVDGGIHMTCRLIIQNNTYIIYIYIYYTLAAYF